MFLVAGAPHLQSVESPGQVGLGGAVFLNALFLEDGLPGLVGGPAGAVGVDLLRALFNTFTRRGAAGAFVLFHFLIFMFLLSVPWQLLLRQVQKQALGNVLVDRRHRQTGFELLPLDHRKAQHRRRAAILVYDRGFNVSHSDSMISNSSSDSTNLKSLIL